MADNTGAVAFANANRDPADRPKRISRRGFMKGAAAIGTMAIAAGYAENKHRALSIVGEYLSDAIYPGVEKELMFAPYTIKTDDGCLWDLMERVRDEYIERTGNEEQISLIYLRDKTNSMNDEYFNKKGHLNEFLPGKNMLLPEIVID